MTFGVGIVKTGRQAQQLVKHELAHIPNQVAPYPVHAVAHHKTT